MDISIEQQGRAIVRGGLSSLDAVDEQAQIRLRNREIPARERAEYASLLFAGYVNHNRGEVAERLPWHRYYGGVILSVGQP